MRERARTGSLIRSTHTARAGQHSTKHGGVRIMTVAVMAMRYYSVVVPVPVLGTTVQVLIINIKA